MVAGVGSHAGAGLAMARAAAALLALASVAGVAATQAITVQAGRRYTLNAGGSILYNETFETSITTQYMAKWNNNNGITYFWGQTADADFTYTIGDTNPESPKDKFRTLMRFNGLHNIIPSNAVVQSAELTVVFINYEAPLLVQACFIGKQWSYVEGPEYKSTGWRYSSLKKKWKKPGAWDDCTSKAKISFVLPSNEYFGYVSQTIALDPGMVASWLDKKGAANYGLLFRVVNGTTSIVTSQWRKDNPALRRPALSITYSTDPSAQVPAAAYPVNLGTVSRVWWCDPSGDDVSNSGHSDSPFKSPAKAVAEAWPGDKIYLKSGVYPGDLDITRSRITLQSAPGHRATVSLPMNDPQNAVNVITLRPGADYGVISDLDITGGYYYGIMFFTSWENYGSMAERVAKGAAPSHWLITNVRIHDTGGSGVKLVMKATNNTFANCEIYNTGARLRTGGHGIEAVQAYGTVVRDCYFHDIPAAAVHLAGGAAGSLLERNFVARANFGFNLGFATDYEYMDAINNPALYECINAIVRNNIITAVSMAGINMWATRGAVVAHNTIWQAQENAQSCILINSYNHQYTPSGDVLTSGANITIWANLLVRSSTARAGPVVQIRAAGLDPATPFVMAHNVYYDQKGLGLVPFQWGKGAMLEDERTGSAFVGNATGWAQHCTVTLGQPLCDVNSIEADPQLDATFNPLQCSPALSRAAPTLPSGSPIVLDDFSGRPRPAGQPLDAGAVQADAPGAPKAYPPVPPSFAGYAPYTGVGLPPVYDKEWPYNYWFTRTCKDIYVDAVGGTDAQDSNYESSYTKPFKTIQQALISINQCDRILLKGGQNHTGGFGIFRPNVTITTNPADLPARATVVCASSGVNPCIRTGEGLYGGAAAINLYNFDVVMGGSTSGNCIMLNEGSGGGTSAYWSFYLAATGNPAPKLSYIKSMTLTNCGGHGIKLSTFVKGVVMEGLTFVSPKSAGIEVRGGGDLTIRGNTILSPGETAIRLGGGVRNVLVERNLIKNFGGRGILLGSDNTEVMYMDVDWARSQVPASWHDNINTLVRNNIIDGGAGAGIAFYSARDAVVVHNTILNVAASMQAGVLLNVSPKQLGPTQETAAPNNNITFKNNIVTLGGPAGTKLIVEARILQGSMVTTQLNVDLPAGSCPAHRHHRRMLRGLVGERAVAGLERSTLADVPGGAAAGSAAVRRELAGMSFADAFVNAPGEQGRNPDGSCPMFPAEHAWHLDVTSLPVHPSSTSIKMNIGGGHLHADFGGGYTSNGKRVLYGIPFISVDSSAGTPLVPIDIGPDGYPDESDASPAGYPFPPDAPVEGAYLNCPDSPCSGDRHVLIVDNATCLLYETWRSFPPAVTGTGRWQADIVARFNLSRNALGRPLGWSSADAAGLAVRAGLVTYEELVVKKVVDHAIRFTGPNSREAYAPPATHFAAHGYQGPDAPYMGMRVRLNASFDCAPLKSAARVFCEALKKYGGIFADNGSPWYFSGEATAKWDSVLGELSDISKIPASAMEVLDTGCLCLDADCTVAECGGVAGIDPNALPVYRAIITVTDLKFANNIYYKRGDTARYVDRWVPGFDGGLMGWQVYIAGDTGSVEANPLIAANTYKPNPGSPAIGKVPRLDAAPEDYAGAPRGQVTDAGAVLG